MKNLLLVFFTILTLKICLVRTCKLQTEKPVEKKDWWQTAQFYQIYPRSFKDSNGDGIGDLNGITEKIPYLKEIGVTAAWLSPIFKSPMKDFGYDISDFYDIQPEYGTIEDFGKLIQQANKYGIKILLDFVPNHSSDESEWFKKSENKVTGYEDYYIWHDGYPDPKNSTNRLPPSNWLSVFRGSAWKWSNKRQQFYFHQFVEGQPDLNYRNTLVVNQMKHVLRYWLNKGVGGFRVDAVPSLFEVQHDKNGKYPDEPISGLTNDTQDHSYLRHIYTEDQPETIDMVYQWRQVLDEHQKVYGGDTRVLLTETYSPVEIVRQYFGNRTMNGAQIPFNFNFIGKTNWASNAKDFNGVISLWITTMPATSTPNWVLGNHDQRRSASRYGVNRTDTMNMMLMILPGASVTYNGEEIGMTDYNITWAQTVDPAACNSNPDIFQKFTRDPARTPFQWDNTTDAGFSTANKTWLPVNPNFKEINVATENQAKRSHLKIYKDLVQLRQTKTLQYGEMIHDAISDDVLVIERYLKNEPTYVLIGNFGDKTQKVNLTKFHNAIATPGLKCIIVSVSSKREKGDVVDGTNFTLDPYEAIIVQK